MFENSPTDKATGKTVFVTYTGLVHAATLGAHAIHHLATLPPLVEHLEDDFRRVLEIGVDHHHDIAGSMIEAGADGDLMAEIAGKMQHLDPGIALAQGEQNFQRAVRAAVIDEDELQPELRRHRGQGGVGPRMEGLDHLLLEINRHHHGEDPFGLCHCKAPLHSRPIGIGRTLKSSWAG